MLKTLLLKFIFAKKIEIFEKKRFFHFSKKNVKIVFLVNFVHKFGKNVKNLVGKLNLDKIFI